MPLVKPLVFAMRLVWTLLIKPHYESTITAVKVCFLGRTYFFPGKKEYTPPLWDPSFLGLSPDPEVTEQKKLWCIPFSWENKGLAIHLWSGKRGKHHRASDPEKEKKGGLHGGGVYFFLPCHCFFSRIVNCPASYRSLSGPPGPKSQKSLPEKVSKKSEKSGKSLENVCSGLFRDFFENPGPESPGDFLIFLGFRARRARETPVARGTVRNSLFTCESANRALVIVLLSRQCLRLSNALSVFVASKSVSTTTPLLKHECRRQGLLSGQDLFLCLWSSGLSACAPSSRRAQRGGRQRHFHVGTHLPRLESLGICAQSNGTGVQEGKTPLTPSPASWGGLH